MELSRPTARPTNSLRSDAALLSAFAALIVIVHFFLGNGYGFHRDELQFLDDARHLQWGFVAYPPLTSFCGRIAIALFGISPQVFRLPAAIVNAVSLVLVGLIAREVGGRRPAQIVALFATLPLALVLSSVLQYGTFDLLAWCIVIFFTVRVLRTADERYWIGVGVGVGIGVLSKYSIAFPVISLFGALVLLPSQRHHLRSRFFWYGALTAALIAAPNLFWLARHHFITLQMEHFIHARDIRQGRADGYYSDQIKFTLFGLPLAVAGLVSLVRNKRFRLLSAFYIGPFLLFALVKGRGYYLTPAYPGLYAAGAVALERVLAQRATWLRVSLRSAVIAAMLADAAVFAWAYLPMWPVGSAAWNWQMNNNSDMANEIGWPEFVAQVAAVRDTLSPQDRSSLAILANNFGEAGALSLYGPQYKLPIPISSTNSFHDRGYGPYEAETVIVVGGELNDQLLNFESCSVAALVHLPYGVRDEESVDHPEILVCHHLRRPWPVVWSRSQEFG
jgi:4-amino-4-deoxy-L-arabinose transferase-like glycosyltransferase